MCTSLGWICLECPQSSPNGSAQHSGPNEMPSRSLITYVGQQLYTILSACSRLLFPIVCIERTPYSIWLHICVLYAPNHRSPHLGDNGCGSTNAPDCNGTPDDDDTYIGTPEYRGDN